MLSETLPDTDTLVGDCLAQISNDNTLRSYRTGLTSFSHFVGQNKLSSVPVMSYRAYIISLDTKPTTKNLRINAVNYLTTYINKVYNANLPLLDVVKFHSSVKKSSLTTEILTKLEMEIKQRPCFNSKDTYFRNRDLTIYWLSCHGLRASEMVKLTLDDMEIVNNHLKLTIFGKGNDKPNIIIASKSLALALKCMMSYEVHNTEIDLSETRQILLNQDYEPLSYSGLYFIFKSLFGENTHPHEMRQVTCSRLIEQGVDLLAIKKFFSWNSLQTATHYDNRVDTALFHIADLIG